MNSHVAMHVDIALFSFRVAYYINNGINKNGANDRQIKIKKSMKTFAVHTNIHVGCYFRGLSNSKQGKLPDIGVNYK